MAAPFFYVGFADFWVADQLNSLGTAFTDLHYLVCFYSHNASLDSDWDVAVHPEQCVARSNWVRPIVMALPAWFRFAQCLRRYRDTREAFPHLVNAGKYSTTFLVVVFGALRAPDQTADVFFVLWAASSVFSSLYAYTWDIKMDWGLMDAGATAENPFLREEIVYSSKAYYYFGVVEDFVLRFSWAISVAVVQTTGIDSEVLTSITSPLEVFRRFVWNFFRLENEHLNNCGEDQFTNVKKNNVRK